MHGLYEVRLDQTVAKDLLKSGGFCLLLNVPPHLVVGLDQRVRSQDLMREAASSSVGADRM